MTIRDVEEKNWIKKLTNSDNYIGQHQENCRKIRDRLKKLEPDINYRILVSNRHLNGASTNLNCQETWENGGMPGDFSGGRFKTRFCNLFLILISNRFIIGETGYLLIKHVVFWIDRLLVSLTV
ncbi:unnamed protein product [Oikopleura dioica]|uniref:Uncharacterized protein n=2 Tax=Oikopleura dioica TaxID=34765 RepID=E4WTY3_OIKDI|nr:unnamed protein product [Oikopleura dioica]